MEFLNIHQRFGNLICLVTNNTKARCIFKSLSHTRLTFSELEQLAYIISNCYTRHGSGGMCVSVDISFSGNSNTVKSGSCVGLGGQV